MTKAEKEKRDFIKNVTVIVDTREQKNDHILSVLDAIGCKYESKKLDTGDYSFIIDDKDFSMSCVIERKSDVNEFYGNIMHDRDRIEREFLRASRNINEFTLLIEDCASMDKLKHKQLTKREMETQRRKVKDIGSHCYSTIMSWQCANRYRFRTIFVKDKKDAAGAILEQFYYYYKNYKEYAEKGRMKNK